MIIWVVGCRLWVVFNSLVQTKIYLVALFIFYYIIGEQSNQTHNQQPTTFYSLIPNQHFTLISSTFLYLLYTLSSLFFKQYFFSSIANFVSLIPTSFSLTHSLMSADLIKSLSSFVML